MNPTVPSSVEDLVDETAIQALAAQIATTRQIYASSNSSNPAAITVSTKLEFKGQPFHQESNIYGLVTLQTPSIRRSSSLSRVPIDLVCVVDQSASMSGAKMILLKQTLMYITEQLTDLDRLAIISFDDHAYDRSHGLKRMNENNKRKLNMVINDDIEDGFSTYIGCGLEMGIEMFRRRQTKNPISALFLLTDGQDDEVHDYSHVIRRLPEDVVCHTFGYGSDHEADLLVQLTEQGNGGTFTYIDKHEAVGPAFAMALAGQVSVRYVDPKSGRTLTTIPVPFHLIRASNLSSEHLRVSYTIDLQRNRIETALALKRAMTEQNYSRSLALLKNQVENIKTSVSARDPFCQQLIKDLEHRYPTERDYRSAHYNAYMQHATERGTYSTATNSSSQIYESVHQQNQRARYQRRYT
ncbi:unnamed protein product [Rotaria sp. Silwood1]|nr:unnamed protein product [Rotaria sp. Silwood1]